MPVISAMYHAPMMPLAAHWQLLAAVLCVHWVRVLPNRCPCGLPKPSCQAKIVHAVPGTALHGCDICWFTAPAQVRMV